MEATLYNSKWKHDGSHGQHGYHYMEAAVRGNPL